MNIWAKGVGPYAAADNLLLYTVGHGSRYGDFYIKDNEYVTEIVPAEDLAGWMNDLQSTMPGRLIFINDSCYSGTFIYPMIPPYGSQFERIIITSTEATERALIDVEGKMSFSYPFWGDIFGGEPLYKAFNWGSYTVSLYIDPSWEGKTLEFGVNSAATGYAMSGVYYDNFSLTGTSAVPIPAALWLFCSGLLGLIGVARSGDRD